MASDSKILFRALPSYVSRGAEKLEAALTHWNINVSEKIAFDIGCSTGGFTDCLLQKGVKVVTALDVGYGQIDPKLRKDSRVLLYEKTHILRWSPPWMGTTPEGTTLIPNLVTMDLSFISIKRVLPVVKTFFVKGIVEFLVLIKPQFEAEKKWLRKGIVQSEEKIQEIVADIVHFSKELGFENLNHFPCPVHGRKGNREVWLRMVLKYT